MQQHCGLILGGHVCLGELRQLRDVPLEFRQLGLDFHLPRLRLQAPAGPVASRSQGTTGKEGIIATPQQSQKGGAETDTWQRAKSTCCMTRLRVEDSHVANSEDHVRHEQRGWGGSDRERKERTVGTNNSKYFLDCKKPKDGRTKEEGRKMGNNRSNKNDRKR